MLNRRCLEVMRSWNGTQWQYGTCHLLVDGLQLLFDIRLVRLWSLHAAVVFYGTVVIHIMHTILYNTHKKYTCMQIVPMFLLLRRHIIHLTYLCSISATNAVRATTLCHAYASYVSSQHQNKPWAQSGQKQQKNGYHMPSVSNKTAYP